MNTSKSRLEIAPIFYPTPLSFHYVAGQQKVLKHLGVSPSIDNGIRYWRVIWRPFLDEPIPYRDRHGNVRLKRKADGVRTERYPIVEGESEADLFKLAVAHACQEYRIPVKTPETLPRVDWDMLARATGQTLRSNFSKPSFNPNCLERAAEMFQKGASNSMVAKEFGVDRSTASRWRKKARSN